MAMKVNTLQDVAKLCGVSTSTVSRVLANEPNISLQTRKKVLEIAKKSGFTPRTRAKHITRSHIKLLIVIPDHNEIQINPFFNTHDIILAINTVFNNDKKHIEIATYSEIINNFKSHSADGIIFAFGDIHQDIEQHFIRANTPYIFLNRVGKNNYISCNNIKGMLSIGHYLYNNGYRCIGYLGYEPNPVNNDRLRGYKLAMDECGMFNKQLIVQVDKITAIDQSIARFFIQNNCDAIMSFNDTFAARLIILFNEFGMIAPRDIAVTGFDHSPAYKNFSPSITTVSLATFEMAYFAARWLRDTIIYKESRNMQVEIDGKLVEGKSVTRRGVAND